MSAEAILIKNSDNNLPNELAYLASEIKTSWTRDTDKTDAMQKLNNFITDILSKNEPLEESLNKDEKLLQYFMTGFMNEVLTNILYQPIVYGKNGDDIALVLLCNIYKLFLKFHQNLKYSPLFERIREIVNIENGEYHFFCTPNELNGQTLRIDNPKKRYLFCDFNRLHISDFMDKVKLEESIFKEGDNVDILVPDKKARNPISKKAWIRGTIKSVDRENNVYYIESPLAEEEIIKKIGSNEILPQGVKTGDWEWRRNLKQYDVIDCFDRNTWFPSTICEIDETVLKNGFKDISYKIGFRLYPKFLKQKNDENYENYKCFWNEKQLELERQTNEEFYGDANCDEDINFYSKRIQKFKTYSTIQKDFLGPSRYMSYSNNTTNRNKIQKINYELENDDEIGGISDDLFFYEKDGKKNYIVGKSFKFSYYFALFLKNLAEEENIFEEFIKIINNKPNSEEIVTIFYTLYHAIPYLHKQYLIDNLDNFKNCLINFINNLTTKEIRNLPKDLIELITRFLNRLSDTLKLEENNENKKDEILLSDEIIINFSIKMIKTSIFDKRIQGIKKLNEYISENNDKENTMKAVIKLIQKSEIIKELFGANYHSQIISKSDKLLALLLKNNEIKEDDIKLIWDCTQRGDLEAKSTIMKLLSDLAENLDEKFINILLENIIKDFNKNTINEKEIDFIYNLSIHGDNENNKIKCCENIYQCVLKLDLNDNIQNNPIMNKLISFATNENHKYLDIIFSMCENDLKANNFSLCVFQILSIILDKSTVVTTEILYINDNIKNFTLDDKLLILYKNNFNSYIERVKALIESNNKEDKKFGTIGNYDDLVIDNYTHTINIQKRLEFLNDWITLIYPSFDFVPFLKVILLDKPVSSNDSIVFYDFMKKYISDTKANESQTKKEKKEKITQQLFKIFIDNNQSNMTMSEFKLFIAIFLKINHLMLFDRSFRDGFYNIILLCDSVQQVKELDKLWKIIFQIKDEKVLNTAISIIFNIYKSKDETNKLLNKCNDLIKKEDTTIEIADKCFKLLRMIIIESEKNNIIKTKSHLNLLKNSVIYLPLKITPKIQHYYYPDNNNENEKDNICEIFYGNTTINEIKEILIRKGKIPLKYIEVNLSKEYMTKIKENENKNNDKNIKDNNKKEENEFLLDETYNNKSISEIINNNSNIELSPNKIFVFYSKNIEKAKLYDRNELNPTFKEILHEWFNEFTDGTGKMDANGCAKYISRVTTRETVTIDDERIKGFFDSYDKENKGYVTEDKFFDFYINAIVTKKEDIVWENLKTMGIREDLRKIDEPDEIPYIDNSKLPRYSLGNDKLFIETLFELFNKFENKKDIFDLLFFLSTNKEIYDNILNNINKKEGNHFEKIFEKKNNILEQLYTLTIIESILQDINASTIDFNGLFQNCKIKDNKEESVNTMNSKNYEYFDDIDINKKKDFLKEFITSKNYEKLLQYMDKLLIEYRFDNKKNDNIVLNICCEKCLKVINILYNTCFNNNTNKDDNISNTIGILSLDNYNLSNIIQEDGKIKESISQMSFLDFATNLIKFITNINNYLNLNTTTTINNEESDNLLQNSFILLINLISHNHKLLLELDSKEEIKQTLSSLIKSALTCKNEYYKSFYIQCLINSIKNSSNLNDDNKFLNLLFELTNNIFNEMMTESIDKSDNISSKSSILFFDFFSLLSSTKTDKAGNDFLLKIYSILFNNLKEIENNKKISNDIFIGLMNILIKRIKSNNATKNIIITKEIDGKTLIEIIFEKIYQKNEEDDKGKELIAEDNKTEEESKFIKLDSIKQDKTQKKNEISQELKEKCNDYLKECFKNIIESKVIFENIKTIRSLHEKLNEIESEEGKTKSHFSVSTKNYDHVGLKNIGCICYMNSIMQQIYMVPTFRYAIMASDDQETPKPTETGRISIEDDNLLHQLQIMYTYLTFSQKEDYNPKYFCYSYKDFDGNPTNPMIQQDSQEFYNNFCDKIENCLKKTKYKYIINDVFTGRTCSSVICESCKNVSNRFEEFYNLTMEVKNITNLYDSLQKMIMPEKIDDFKCDACNQKVTISKRTTLCDLPNVLVIQLKRFYMNYEIERTEKINSRFEFPLNINLKEFCIEDIVQQITGKQFESEDIYVKEDDYYNYELKGINIHMGSADGGHYFSLINVERDGKGNILLDKDNKKDKDDNKDKEEKKYTWLKFNDSHISIFDTNDVEKECFGGASKGSSYNFENFQNAYMLIYERKKKSPVRIIYNKNEIKDNATEDNKNIVKINKDNRKEIKKKYDLYRKNTDIDDKSIYDKLFIDEEREEIYKYVQYYNIEKYAPRNIYNQVMEKNKKLEKMKNNDEKELNKYKIEYYDILLNNISSDDFNILSDSYNAELRKELLSIYLDSIFNLTSNKYPSKEEKVMINSKTKIILEKIVLPFFNQLLQNIGPGSMPLTGIDQNICTEYNLYYIIINTLLMHREKLEKIYVNDLTAIFDNYNVELFSKIIKGLIMVNYNKKTNQYLSIIEYLFNLIQNVDTSSTYPSNNSQEKTKIPLTYVFEMVYQAILQDKKTTEKIINQNGISTFLGKLINDNIEYNNIIYDIVLHLIKNTEEYNDKLFDINNNEKICNCTFYDKKILIKGITPSIVELLFEEKVELLIILIKILQYNQNHFSTSFNIDNIILLYEYSLKKDRMKDMLKIIYAILEINDKYTFNRVNSILGYPTMIIKHVKNKKADINGNNNNIDSYEEKKEREEEEEDKKEKVEEEKNNYWPLFGERLLMEEDNENSDKLKKHLFKYIGIMHRYEKYCLLGLLFPSEKNNNQKKEKEKELFDENERKKLIYDLLKLVLLGRGNYCLFKYIYLLPSRTLYYNNLYEEMIDILEQENLKNNNLYDLSEIKKNADMCIKRVNYEVEKTLNSLKNNEMKYDEYKISGEYKLPEMMEKYYVNDNESESFTGANPKMLQSDIVREEIKMIAGGSNMFLMRLEYFTKYKTIDEIKNNINNSKMESKKEEKKEKIEKKVVKNEEEEKVEETEEKKEEEKIEEENKEEEQKEEEDNEELWSDDNDRIIKYDISNINFEIDGKDFMMNVIKKINRVTKVVIEDSSIKNKSKIKSSLIRFIIISLQSSENGIHITVSKKDIPEDIKHNYYYPENYYDYIKERNISNFMNINRLRPDIKFLKLEQIGINIDVQKVREYEL